jgi:hypothetical protein
VMLSGFSVVPCGMREMFGCLLVVFCSSLRHSFSPLFKVSNPTLAGRRLTADNGQDLRRFEHTAIYRPLRRTAPLERTRPTSRRGGWPVVVPSASFRTPENAGEASYAFTCTIRVV